MLLKENRTRRAWTILIPAIAVLLTWHLLKGLLSGISGPGGELSRVITILVTLLSALWLLGDRIAKRRPAASFFLALAIVAVLLLLAVTCQCSLNFGQLEMICFITCGCMMLSFLSGIILTRYRCRNRYSTRRFLLWLLLWMEVTMLVVVSVYVAIIMVSVQVFREHMFEMIAQLFIVATIGAVMLYLAVLPFILLSFWSPLYGQRLRACLRLNNDH